MITQVSKIVGLPELLILEGLDNAICEVRQLYWKLLRMRGYSYTEIGRLSCRNHSTIVLGIKHIDGLIKTDKEIAGLWEEIKQIKR